MDPDHGMTEESLSKTPLENEVNQGETSKTVDNTGLTETNTSNIQEQNASLEGLTGGKTKGKAGRPAREGVAPVTWSVRGVERDTRAVLEKAAERAGKTMGQYMNDEVRAYAQGQLTQSQLPTSPKDLQVQVEQLTQLVEGIAARMAEPARKGFWQRVFGK
jgi:uncharacterized protein (DUF1778 family)